jgi:hypothetical protein
MNAFVDIQPRGGEECELGHSEGSPDVRQSEGPLTGIYKVRESAPVLK